MNDCCQNSQIKWLDTVFLKKSGTLQFDGLNFRTLLFSELNIEVFTEVFMYFLPNSVIFLVEFCIPVVMTTRVELFA